MASFITKKCPTCGKNILLTSEAAKIGIVCPQCKTIVGQKDNRLTEEERKKITAAIHSILKK
ncbi:MAG: hypothetical protein ACI4Q4_02005 [Oscillospiraceae bacterium]